MHIFVPFFNSHFMKKQIIDTAVSLMREHFTCRELSSLLGVDYQVMFSYYLGVDDLPLKYAFFFLEWLGYSIEIKRIPKK